MKKEFYLFSITLLLTCGFFITFCPTASSDGFSIWPPSFTININDWDYEGEITQRFEINNLNPYDVNVTIIVNNPIPYRRKSDFDLIPDLSWVKTEPERVFIPAGHTRKVEVSILVPENKKQQYYNEHWEVWLTIGEETSEKTSLFLISLNIKCFIHTPAGSAKTEFPQFPFLILLLIIGGVAVAKFISYASKRKRIINMNKSTVFYVKKKKRNNTKKKKRNNTNKKKSKITK